MLPYFRYPIVDGRDFPIRDRIRQQILDYFDLLAHRVELLLVRSRCPERLDGLGFLDRTVGFLLQTIQYHVPIVEAFAARFTVRSLPEVSPCALIALVTTDSRVTDTLTQLSITLERG